MFDVTQWTAAWVFVKCMSHSFVSVSMCESSFVHILLKISKVKDRLQKIQKPERPHILGNNGMAKEFLQYFYCWLRGMKSWSILLEPAVSFLNLLKRYEEPDKLLVTLRIYSFAEEKGQITCQHETLYHAPIFNEYIMATHGKYTRVFGTPGY
jgi:hypothetical protein